MVQGRQIDISESVQLFVEGNDQRNFFRALLDHMEIGNVQVQNYGGIGELAGFLRAVAPTDQFRDAVKSLGIVQDVEQRSAQSAFASIQSSLRNAQLPVPDQPRQRAGTSPVVSALLLPDDDNSGMLETLLCRTFAGSGLDGCIDSFFECMRDITGSGPHRPEKARAHAYLATQRDPHVSVGVAAMSDHGYWDLDHPALDGVRNFLRSL